MIINKISSSFISEFFLLLLQDLVLLYPDGELSLRVIQDLKKDLKKEIIKYLNKSLGQRVLPRGKVCCPIPHRQSGICCSSFRTINLGKGILYISGWLDWISLINCSENMIISVTFNLQSTLDLIPKKTL